MKVSIIIPTYNEAEVIGESLLSLNKQSFKDFEVIVIDDGSTDKTWIVLSKIRNSKFEIRKLHAKHVGAGGARNLGAKHAKGDILIFVDADMTFDKNFIKNLIKPIVSGKVRGTFSKNEIVSNWDNLWARCWNINEGWEAKKRHPKNYPDTQPVFRAILKKEFDKVGGFTPGGYDDDWSLFRKLGYKAQVAPNAIFFHKNPSSLKEIFNHAKWASKRHYKLGITGLFIALIRCSLPFSLLFGVLYAIRNSLYSFIIFKLIYDAGAFVGIVNYIFTRNGAK